VVDKELTKPYWKEVWTDAKKAPKMIERDVMTSLNWVDHEVTAVYNTVTG
jgi:hypothetical protein